jgi:hypothetical protein
MDYRKFHEILSDNTHISLDKTFQVIKSGLGEIGAKQYAGEYLEPILKEADKPGTDALIILFSLYSEVGGDTKHLLEMVTTHFNKKLTNARYSFIQDRIFKFRQLLPDDAIISLTSRYFYDDDLVIATAVPLRETVARKKSDEVILYLYLLLLKENSLLANSCLCLYCLENIFPKLVNITGDKPGIFDSHLLEHYNMLKRKLDGIKAPGSDLSVMDKRTVGTITSKIDTAIKSVNDRTETAESIKRRAMSVLEYIENQAAGCSVNNDDEERILRELRKLEKRLVIHQQKNRVSDKLDRIASLAREAATPDEVTRVVSRLDKVPINSSMSSVDVNSILESCEILAVNKHLGKSNEEKQVRLLQQSSKKLQARPGLNKRLLIGIGAGLAAAAIITAILYLISTAAG